jgi:hypothetical protein
MRARGANAARLASQIFIILLGTLLLSRIVFDYVLFIY